MSDAPVKRKWIPREAWRQEKAAVFAREAITCEHLYMAFDRSQAHDARSHLYEARRGVRKGTPDTLTIAHGRHIWAEFKSATGRTSPEQAALLARLVSAGDVVGVCRTIEDYRVLLLQAGIPLRQNAHVLSHHYDAVVDGRIMKAEDASGPAKPKRVRSAGPRFLAGKRLAAQMYKG